MAKVVSVFERSADVLLIWSPRRDIHDLKIKAYLRLVETKRYSLNNNRASNYNRQNSDVLLNRNLEVSELIFVELVQWNETSRKIEVMRRKSLMASDDSIVDDTNEDDDSLLNEERYRPKSPSRISFHDYMMDHDHLQNPSLIKQPTFTSLLYGNQVIESYKRKLQATCSKEKEANSTHIKKEEDEVVIIQERKPEIGPNGVHLNRSNSFRGTYLPPKVKSNQNESFKSQSGVNHSNSVESESRKRTLLVASDRTLNSQHDSSRRSIHLSSNSSSSSSSSSDSSSDTSSSSDDSYRRRKRKQKGKSNRSKKQKKRSKKSKKKKSKKSKDRNRESPDRGDRGHKRKKIDDKIMKLLKLT